MVTIVKCPCLDPICKYYSLSDGHFYQGNGWNKKRAQEYADAINFHAQLVAENQALMEIAQQTAFLFGNVDSYPPESIGGSLAIAARKALNECCRAGNEDGQGRRL